MRLEGQHILVTGGSRGIGLAVVEKALAEGWLTPEDIVQPEWNHCRL